MSRAILANMVHKLYFGLIFLYIIYLSNAYLDLYLSTQETSKYVLGYIKT